MKVDLIGGRFDAVLFDMDGVLTNTNANTHRRAWKKMFDAFLEAARQSSSVSLSAPSETEDYELDVERQAALRRGSGFSQVPRNPELPEEFPEDPPDRRRSAVWATARTRWSLR